MSLHQKNILLGVTGGIAAYKTPNLVRLLKKQGANVQVVMTEGAKHFTTATTLQAVSGLAVRDSLWDSAAEASMGHIELARWADAILIAPATADVMARLAHGAANDLLTTLCLATDAPISLAPAMNHLMWKNKATQTNLLILQKRGIQILGPDEGDQACGEYGPGRMLEPEDIVQSLMHTAGLLKDPSQKISGLEFPQVSLFNEGNKSAVAQTEVVTKFSDLLKDQHVVITTGPTQEAIDPVRFVTNHSSGKMGFALAKIAAKEGAKVTLIAGPVKLDTPEGVERIDVRSATDMHAAVMKVVSNCNVFIATAAVADYRPKQVAAQKIKKDPNNLSDELNIVMQRNPDILADVAQVDPRPVCVGFAAETENLEENAKRKLKAKRVDLIAANLVGEGLTFGQDESTLKVFWQGGEQLIQLAHKERVAQELLEIVVSHIEQNFAQTMVAF